MGKVEKFIGVPRLETYLLGGAEAVALHNDLGGETAEEERAIIERRRLGIS
jgi:hypothetical protein